MEKLALKETTSAHQHGRSRQAADVPAPKIDRIDKTTFKTFKLEPQQP